MTSHRTAAAARSLLPTAAPVAGLTPDAVVMTADGAIPAAYLETGDRIVTRRGMRRVLAAIRRPWPGSQRPVLVLRDALGGKPDRACILPEGQRLLVRDWRARALWHRDAAVPEAGALVDGTFIRWSATRPVELLQFFLGQPELILVDGLQLASADPVRQPAATRRQAGA
jgi:hypothetical protein